MQRAFAARVAAAAIAAAALAASGTARAQDAASGGPRADDNGIVWKYPTFGTGEYVATGIFAGLAVGGLAIPGNQPRLTGMPGFDESARDALRLPTLAARKTADDISDLTLTVSLNYVLVDSLFVVWLGYDRGSVAYQMTAIDFETLAFTTAVTSIVKSVTARERPYFEECGRGGRLVGTDDCDPQSVDRSFFSGHTSTSFAAASLTCMHHAYLPLYGGGAGDVAACVGAYGVAATTGVLRVMSDNHYVSDVAVGAAFGTAAGLGLPWLLHYREEVGEPKSAPAQPKVTWHVVPGPLSANVVGTF